MKRRRFNLTRAFQDVEYSTVGFPAHTGLDTLRNAFRTAVGKRFAIPLNDLFPILEKVLSQGRMSQMNAAAFICINSNEHESSKFSRLGFLKKFLDLYTAETWQECAKIEGIKPSSPDSDIVDDYSVIQQMGEGTGRFTDKLEKVKSFCWLRDVNHATRPNLFEKILKRTQHVSSMSIQNVLSCYNKKAAAALDAADKEETKKAKLEKRAAKKDLMALPKEEFLPLLRKAKNAGNLSDTQCAMMLMFILHSREKRHDGETYIKHPVAVAKLVEQYGGEFLGNDEGDLWMATIAALLHDAWEENDIKSIRKDLKGLLPLKVIDAVVALHKQEGETYFGYLQRVANNRLASVVKLCDLSNNTMDMDLAKNKGTSKQAFVYSVAANYMKFRMENVNEDISVEDFVLRTEICSDEHFKEINEIAESKDLIDEKGLEVKADKKKPAFHFPHLLKAFRSVISAKDILKDKIANADPRREENPSLQL